MAILDRALALASVLLIANTIRLSMFARRREVEVMKLVGATDSFIRWPFLIEGMVLGALGGMGGVHAAARQVHDPRHPRDEFRHISVSHIPVAELAVILIGASGARQRNRVGTLAAPLPARLEPSASGSGVGGLA